MKKIIKETVNDVLYENNHKKRIARDKMFMMLFNETSITESVLERNMVRLMLY
jgi:hypothetical protein